MGRRGRERFNAGSGTRRRTVLQIEPVSRRKENEGKRGKLLFITYYKEEVKIFRDFTVNVRF